MHGITLIRNANLYAPQPQGVVDLLVAGGHVVWVGSGPHPAYPFPVATRDVEGRVVVPGLIDPHVHVTGGGGEAGAASRVPPLALSIVTGAGVTTVVGLLGTDDTIRTTDQLVVTIHGLRELGLNAFGFTGGYHVPPVTLTGSIRRDIVTIECLIGIGELAISDHRSSQPTDNEIMRLAADAHVAGLMTNKAGVVHFHVGDGPRGLAQLRTALATAEIPARVYYPTHVNRRRALFDEAIDLARKGCTIDVTAFPVAEGEDAYSAADALEKFWECGAPAGRITVSSDAGGCLPEFDDDGRVTHFDVGAPGALIATIAELVGRGHPPEQVLPPFTSHVAQHLRLHDVGRLVVNSRADLCVVDEAWNVVDVMAGGVWMVQHGRPLITDKFE